MRQGRLTAPVVREWIGRRWQRNHVPGKLATRKANPPGSEIAKVNASLTFARMPRSQLTMAQYRPLIPPTAAPQLSKGRKSHES
jgi:hypothetical protein